MTLYHVSGTGDSILYMVRPLIAGADRWFDFEQGRDIDTPGNMGRASTLSIWPAVLNHSDLGGWILIQDNGANCTDDRWRAVLAMMVRGTPTTRKLLGVFPAYLESVSPGGALNARAKATIMAQEFIRFEGPYQFIHWNTALENDPSLVYDGQHPSSDGIDWLANAINTVVG